MDDLKLSAIVILIGGVIWVFGGGITTAAQRHWQSRLDQKAKLAVSSGDLESYSLYLRPFELDGSTLPQPKRIEFYEYFGKSSLIRSIAEALDRTCPLIGLGDRADNPYGFGAAGTLEGGWEQRVRRAIQTSKVIILVPSSSSGVLWEIAEIVRGNHLRKTVFVMPPRSDLEGSGYPDAAEFWKLLQATLNQEFDLKLPDYAASGGLFAFNRDIVTIRTFDQKVLHDGTYVAQQINAILHSS